MATRCSEFPLSNYRKVTVTLATNGGVVVTCFVVQVMNFFLESIQFDCCFSCCPSEKHDNQR